MKPRWRPIATVVLAAAIVLAAGQILAQRGGDGGNRGGRFGGQGGFGGPFGGGGLVGLVIRDDVQQELQLVDEQSDNVAGVVEEARNRMRDEFRDLFRQMGNLSDEERQERFDEIRSRVESINADMEKRLKKALLPHQFERLKQIDLQARIQQRGAEALTSGELADVLNLTDAQRKKLEQRSEEVQQELQEKIQQLRIEARNKILAVLSPDQRAKLEAMMGDQFDSLDQGPGFGGRGFRGGFRGAAERDRQ
jgi:Spy/CpxP family protein refolding chaperone